MGITDLTVTVVFFWIKSENGRKEIKIPSILDPNSNLYSLSDCLKAVPVFLGSVARALLEEMDNCMSLVFQILRGLG